MIQYSAIVSARVGEKDLALQNLTKAAQLPGFVTYGRLKLLPWYDPLRALIRASKKSSPRSRPSNKIISDLRPPTSDLWHLSFAGDHQTLSI